MSGLSVEGARSVSGPDLKVDYDLLDGSAGRLRQMKSFFEGIKDWGQSCEGDWGSGSIASAMSGHFAGNWDIHRKGLVESMDSLAELCDTAVKSFQDGDTKLANSLTGQAK